MTQAPRLTRRAALAGAATLPLAAATVSATSAFAQNMGPTAGTSRSFALGDFTVTLRIQGQGPHQLVTGQAFEEIA